MATETRKAPIDAAIQDEASDLALAEELRDQVKVVELYALTRRLIGERRKLAEGFKAVISGFTMLRNEDAPGPSQDAIQSIERVAHEAIAFAREVVQALTRTKDGQ